MKSPRELLLINDQAAAVEQICNYIKDAVGKEAARGVIIGLSGGLDSALLTTLAVRALGKDKVRVYFLHDKNSESDSLAKARLVADWLGLTLNLGSITERMREREKKASFFKWLSAMPEFMVPIVSAFYYIVVGETPYITTLRKMEIRKSKFKKWIYDNIMTGVESMFDGPCSERRILLEGLAKKDGMLILGSGNYSENMTGWFTITGVDNMPYSPIGRLYKVQVIQLSAYLNIPDAVLKRHSTADVLRGATDTIALGMDFDKIDAALYGIEHGLTDESMMEYGLTLKEIERVRKINKLSEWKRRA